MSYLLSAFFHARFQAANGAMELSEKHIRSAPGDLPIPNKIHVQHEMITDVDILDVIYWISTVDYLQLSQ